MTAKVRAFRWPGKFQLLSRRHFICMAVSNLNAARPAIKAGQGRSGVMGETQKAGVEVKPRSRYTELKQMLLDRRRELQAAVQGKMRDVRAAGEVTKVSEVLDAVESSEADIQEDIELALIQMKSETLNKIVDALARLEQGNY